MLGISKGDHSKVSNQTSPSTSIIIPAMVIKNSSTSLQIITKKLNGKNYLQWPHSASMVIRGKGKISYLDGLIPKPPTSDSSYQTWDTQNSMVMAWLIHSIEDNIGDTYLFYPTAKEIWDIVSLAYSHFENSSQMFELRNKAQNLKQEDSDVTQYFNALKKLWHELDLFNTCEWKDPEDEVLFKKMVDKYRVYDFLAGLNRDLDEVRGRIFGVTPLLVIDEVFSEVRREEYRRKVMFGEVLTPVTENSALVVQDSTKRGNFRPPAKRSQAWCDHCQKSYHTKDKCWDLHGKPANWVPN